MKQIRTTDESSKAAPLSAYSQAKRDQIIQGAVKVFLKHGYEGTSMNRVAEEAGVIKQTIYSHFNDKEGLFVAIIESLTLKHFEDQFGYGIENFDNSLDPKLVLRMLANAFLNRQKDKQYIALFRTVIGESNRFPELTQLYTRTVIQRGITVLTVYFDQHPELKFKDTQAMARIFAGAIVNNIVLSEILYGNEIMPFEAERLVDQLIDLVLSYPERQPDKA